jgi:hypothetical protein
MSDYQVRIRYAGSVLVEVKADNEAQAREKGEQIARQMNSDAFLSALELQHLGTEVTHLCSACRCELQAPEQRLCSECEGK